MTQARERVNDFAFKIGTVNGTGSASANGLLRTAIFRMGVPVSGKNVFPSNIQGLPTWYEIRVNGEGHTARTPHFDLAVAMNPATYERDIAEVVSGGWLLHDSSWPMSKTLGREDITFLGVPLADMCVKNFEGPRERILMKNIAYVGALTALLDIELDVIKQLLEETFGERKPHLLDSNMKAIRLGFDYAREHFDVPLPIRLERMDETAGSILIDGNTAAALGCVFAGATVAAWYPITPSTSLVDAFTRFCNRYRVDPETKQRNCAIIQAEDELAAAGMVIGAGWAGARAFTATSGAGISLMSEFLGLAYYTETPGVFFDVQRVGPSTGMPTRTQQGDLLFLAYASHGDTLHICLFPADPGECFELAVAAFDLTERYQTPVFVVTDLDVGMNDWVVPTFEWDDAYVPDRGKVLDAEALEEVESFYRYLDVDGDGVPYRTLPGVGEKGAFFTRGSGHDKYGRYTEDSEAYTEVVDRLRRKVEGAAEALPEPVVEWLDDEASPGRYGLLTVGGCDRAVREAMVQLADQELDFDYMRVRAFPFARSVADFIEAHERVFVIEQNRDAQLQSLLLLHTPARKEQLRSVRYYGGLPMSAHHVVEGICAHLSQTDTARGAEDAEGVATGEAGTSAENPGADAPNEDEEAVA